MHYRRDVELGRVNEDPVQLRVLTKLDDLQRRLCARWDQPPPGLLQRLLQRRPKAPERGLYRSEERRVGKECCR